MKKIIILAFPLLIFAYGLSSCSGCVKKASKKATELGLSVVEGVSEAVDEHGEVVAEKTADAASKLATGVGRSLEKQLNEHAKTVASVSGRTLVQSLDGLSEGVVDEAALLYDEVPHTQSLASGVSLQYIGKYKKADLVDANFLIPENGNYMAKFECSGNDGKIFLIKNIEIDRTNNDTSKRHIQVSFAMNTEESTLFSQVKNVHITVTKK